MYCTLSNTGCDTTSKVGTKFSGLKPPAVLLSEFDKSLSSPIPLKLQSNAKLSNNLFKYSNPTEHVLLWMIVGMKYTTKVKLVITIPNRLPFLILHLHFLRYMYTTYIQTHWLQNVTVDPTKYTPQNNWRTNTINYNSDAFCLERISKTNFTI